jgi:hypothetical protein
MIARPEDKYRGAVEPAFEEWGSSRLLQCDADRLLLQRNSPHAAVDTALGAGDPPHAAHK